MSSNTAIKSRFKRKLPLVPYNNWWLCNDDDFPKNRFEQQKDTPYIWVRPRHLWISNDLLTLNWCAKSGVFEFVDSNLLHTQPHNHSQISQNDTDIWKHINMAIKCVSFNSNINKYCIRLSTRYVYCIGWVRQVSAIYTHFYPIIKRI